MAVVTGVDLYKKYGHPKDLQAHFVVWNVPVELQKGKIPKKVYCHPDLIPHLTQAFKNLISTGRWVELQTWDGVVNFRPIRGYEDKYAALMKAGKIEEAMKYLSIHSWGLACDVNAATNGLGKPSTLTPEFVKCFKDADFDWGGDFKRVDAMHWQVAKN